MSQSSDHTAREIDRRVYQRHALLALLRARGKEGATNVELSEQIGLRFGGRIFELRHAGHPIVGANLGRGLWRYFLSAPIEQVKLSSSPITLTKQLELFTSDGYTHE